MTPDLSPLCWPSAGLSGDFVEASWLNSLPADRHVVYPVSVMSRRYTAECVRVLKRQVLTLTCFTLKLI